MQFTNGKFRVKVNTIRDQYNDYSVAYDVHVTINNTLTGESWDMRFTANGEDQTSIMRSFDRVIQSQTAAPKVKSACGCGNRH
jgi:hypothetical protein